MSFAYDMTLSEEAEIDEELEALIAKMVQGKASAADRDLYARLSIRRAELMQPAVFRRLSRIRETKRNP